MRCWKDAHFLGPCHKTRTHYLIPPLPPHLPKLMAHNKLIILVNLDYYVCSPDQHQQFVKHM